MAEPAGDPSIADLFGSGSAGLGLCYRQPLLPRVAKRSKPFERCLLPVTRVTSRRVALVTPATNDAKKRAHSRGIGMARALLTQRGMLTLTKPPMPLIATFCAAIATGCVPGELDRANSTIPSRDAQASPDPERPSYFDRGPSQNPDASLPQQDSLPGKKQDLGEPPDKDAAIRPDGSESEAADSQPPPQQDMQQDQQQSPDSRFTADQGVQLADQRLTADHSGPSPDQQSSADQGQPPALDGGQALHPLALKMVRIPAGTFEMGKGALRGGVPVRTVTISRPFWIAKTELTNVQYEAFDPAHRSKRHSSNRGDHHPVSFVNWSHAVAFCTWLTSHTNNGWVYRLPTEAEWEWAARGGSAADIDTPTRSEANSWGKGGADIWDETKTAPVASLKPNAFGLYDTLGNISEWVTTENDGSRSYRIHKGRSFHSGVELGMTPPDRQSYKTSELGKKVGFRIVAEKKEAR
jgi:formylglycine-generating enzyme required for sulfatase activity